MTNHTDNVRQMATQSRLLDIAGAAEVLNVTPRFIRRLIAERRVPFLKIGKFIRFNPDELTDWINDQRVDPHRQAS